MSSTGAGETVDETATCSTTVTGKDATAAAEEQFMAAKAAAFHPAYLLYATEEEEQGNGADAGARATATKDAQKAAKAKAEQPKALMTQKTAKQEPLKPKEKNPKKESGAGVNAATDEQLMAAKAACFPPTNANDLDAGVRPIDQNCSEEAEVLDRELMEQRELVLTHCELLPTEDTSDPKAEEKGATAKAMDPRVKQNKPTTDIAGRDNKPTTDIAGRDGGEGTSLEIRTGGLQTRTGGLLARMTALEAPTTSLTRYSATASLAASLPGAFSYDGPGSSVGGLTDLEDDFEDSTELEGTSQAATASFAGTAFDDIETASRDSGLVVADEVMDQSESQWQRAQAVDMEQAAGERKNFKRVWNWGLAGAGVCVLVVLVVVLATVLGGKSKESDQDGAADSAVPTPPPSTAAPTSPEEHLMSLLPVATQDEILHYNSFGPPKQAYEWMLQDPYLANYTSNRLVQRYALATFFYSTTDANLEWYNQDDWLSYDVHECDWYNYYTHGFYNIPETETLIMYNATNATAPCDEDGLYEHLWLLKNGLEGTLPDELFLLTNLKSISLDRNVELQGTLSTLVGHLTNLEALALYNNKHTGTIPTQLGLLTHLESFWVMSNFLSGTIPTELGLLSDSMVNFLVDTNHHLTGTFPTELGQLSNLVWLWLYRNSFTGSLPTEIGLMESLGSLAIDFNPWEGTIPTQVGTMSSLWTLHVEASFISGTIPTEIGLCEQMDSLVMSDTLISGTIPTEIGLLTNMVTRLWAWDTPLSGALPSELGLLTQLETLVFRNNSFTGSIPSELGNMDKVWRVHLNENQLTGTVPTEIGQLQNLWDLWLFHNGLTGQIPSELGALDQTVDFWQNSTNSTVEYWNITDIQLDNNMFTGLVPSALGLLLDLSILSIHNNSGLEGSVPLSYCGMEELTVSADCALVECNCSVCDCI